MKQLYNYEPLIKWPGNKRKIAHIIQDIKYDSYIEPFCGGCSILPYRKCEDAYCFDIIPELIELWNNFKNEKISKVIDEYTQRWQLFQKNDDAYYSIRDNFNKTRNSYDFLFLSRTCISGRIRFNTKNEFNQALEPGRKGIKPDRLQKILTSWKPALQKVSFFNEDYKKSLDYIKPNTLFS